MKNLKAIMYSLLQYWTEHQIHRTVNITWTCDTQQLFISSSLILTVAQTARFLAEASAIEEVSSYTLAMVGLSPEKQMNLKHSKSAQGLGEILFLKCQHQCRFVCQILGHQLMPSSGSKWLTVLIITELASEFLQSEWRIFKVQANRMSFNSLQWKQHFPQSSTAVLYVSALYATRITLHCHQS